MIRVADNLAAVNAKGNFNLHFLSLRDSLRVVVTVPAFIKFS